MAIGGWRQGIPGPRRGGRRPPPPPPPPAGSPVLTGFTEEDAGKFQGSQEKLSELLASTADASLSPSSASAFKSSMQAQADARKSSGQSVKVP